MVIARILPAENDEGRCSFLACALKRAGHEVIAVHGGLAGQAAFDDASFELLIADIVMPGMDGIELSRCANALNADLKVMFVTGFATVAMSARDEFVNTKVLSELYHLRELVDNVDRIFAA